MSDSPVLGVVLQLTRMTALHAHASNVLGLPAGTLAIGALDTSGLSINFDSAAAVRHLAVELDRLAHRMDAMPVPYDDLAPPVLPVRPDGRACLQAVTS